MKIVSRYRTLVTNVIEHDFCSLDTSVLQRLRVECARHPFKVENGVVVSESFIPKQINVDAHGKRGQGKILLTAPVALNSATSHFLHEITTAKGFQEIPMHE